MMRKGLLIVYSGPSGVGKGTILGPYLKEHPEAVLSVSMTTRAPRPGETDGVEYHFVTREQFESEIAAGGLLEYAQYSGNYYGTPHRMVEEQRAQGRDVVLEIEVQGAAHIRKVCPDAVFIFVMPPSYETLENRLSGRGTEPPEVVQRRLEAARTELRCAAEYDYIIVNDDLEEARARLGAVIIAARCEARRMKNMIDTVEQNV